MNIQRHFILGDNWLYFKIYTGFKTADLLLRDAIYPLSQQLKLQKLISHWFFVRYNDPDFHLRVRFYLPKTQTNGEIIQQIHNSLQEYFQNGMIWKIQYDTYNREIERYGKNTMELSEQIFCADSEMVVELLKNTTDNQRWLLSLRAIDELLTIFGYNIEKKAELLKILQENFAKEFKIEGKLVKQFSQNFRENRKEIEKIMTVNNEENILLLPVFSKSAKIQHYINKFLEFEKDKKMQVSFNDLLSSYIHLMLNRFFRTQPRKHELVLYDYLYRYYNSEINKLKYQEKNNQK
jgi:thiopeptide-type bacteriocin biosynthesis protein